MPILTFGYFSLQLNRGSIGNALTDNFMQDVGITQNQFNIGQQLLSAGIVLFEIPSNLVLYRIGPTYWIGGQIIAWSLVGMFQAFQHGLGAFLATRLLLGICESGFIPGSLFVITKWYKTYETSKRFAIHYCGAMAGAAVGGLFAYGILRHLDGRAGFAGWQWLFVIEGLIAFTCGLIFILIFPKDPSNPVSIMGFSYFDERQKYILRQRIIADDKTKAAQADRNVTRGELFQTPQLTNWRLIPHVIITLCYLSPAQALGSYGPLLIVGMGFDPLEANAMGTISAWCAIFGSLGFGYVSDIAKSRGPLMLVGMITRFSLLTVMNLFKPTLRKYVLTNLCLIVDPLHGSWLAMNCQTQAERSITMAIHIMGANLAGVIGGQFFRSEDTPPYYPRGWTVIVAMTVVAVAAAIFANAQYLLLNWHARKGSNEWRFTL
ncbi:major facilitator superfamily domain-containing protein [Plectosphaerella plurivora]|uniref:Major facilitator superfamily domain-containing protein n=1 Tax=Plectosphaerella plurivora TaxID=936078 RepID=A0A9P8V7Y2_9PEZI|nr:major facilitator superfamily domain-containing protein [Plectosphaerella plurivora]